MKSLSCVRLLAIPWTAAYQAPPSMGFSRQEYWSGMPLPPPLVAVSGGLFCSCSVRASHCGGFSCCKAQAQGTWVSVAVACVLVVVAPGLQSPCSAVVHRLIALRHVGSSRIRNRAHVFCIGKRILYHWFCTPNCVLDVWLTNIFSHSVACLFFFLI